MTQAAGHPAANKADLDRRITFHADDQIMEVDFSDFEFDGTLIVNAVYDRLEARIADTRSSSGVAPMLDACDDARVIPAGAAAVAAAAVVDVVRCF